MKIHIYTIHKHEMFVEAVQHYSKACKGFGVEITFLNLFTKHIQDAQKQEANIAKQSYTKAFEKYLDGQSVLLDSSGRLHDSLGFKNMIETYSMQGIIKFFIAGAFGFEKAVLQKYPKISLSPLTFSHEIAKIVLAEQIYRSLSIIKNHPYHKL